MDVVMRLPDLATNASAIKVVRWLVEVGQDVKRGQPLVEVETDKAVMEVESVVTGTLRSQTVAPGGEAEVGDVIAVFETTGVEQGRAFEVSPAASVTAAAPVAEPERATSQAATSLATSERRSFFARNRQARQAQARPAPVASSIALSVPQRTLARRMCESQQTIPHFYLQTSANAEAITARRDQAAASGTKIVWDAFFVQAIAKALKRYERMGYRFEEDRLIPQGVDALGVAVDLNDELFTVVVERPLEKSLEQVSAEIRSSVERLRSGDPLARVSQRAVMTVTNLGAMNVESFAAIINPPEAAILAVGKVMPQAHVLDGSILIQRRVNLTLTVDHRVVNGKYAAGFLGAIVEAVEAF